MESCGWAVNRIEEEWGSQAEEFDPDRWTNKSESDNSTHFAFACLSHGPRSCIGQGFARVEFLVFLAALLANFRIYLDNPDEDPVVLYGITMSPAGGINTCLVAN